MRNLILFAVFLATAFQTALGEQDGDWTYSVTNNQATITRWNWGASGGAVTIPSEVNGIPVVRIESEYGIIFGAIWNNYINYNITSITIPESMTNIGKNAFYGMASLTNVVIPNSVTEIGERAFDGCISLQNIAIPNSVIKIHDNAFANCTSLTRITMPDRFAAEVAQIGVSGQVATDYLINTLANNDAFVTAVANKILAKSGNYGLSVKSELETFATKTELTSSLAQSRTDGINSVLSNPNLWTLYTTSQIQNMAVGDLVLTRQVSGGFVLNYDIQQSTDLQTWTPYQALSLPLNGLPTDKAFVRIKAKQADNLNSGNVTPGSSGTSSNPVNGGGAGDGGLTGSGSSVGGD